ncbi:MAG: hypothetical protein WC675_03375 [Patescibacteria group bacterium]|jgi:hypothetical protein
MDSKQNNSDNNKELERLMRDFGNVANALAMYPPGHPLAVSQLNKLYQKITSAFESTDMLAIHQGEGILIINDKQIAANTPSIKKIVEHLNDFKVTDLEITKGISLEELKNFLEIITHSQESMGMYPDLKTACEKNQITHIQSLQAAYIRVPKNVKDKLGGKIVGELKISTDEMKRLVAYLKGEVALQHPGETKIYKKVFAKPELLSNLVDQIIVESANQEPEKRKKLVIVVLNQIGRYLAQDSTNPSRQNQNVKIIDALAKALNGSKNFIALGADNNLKNEVSQTVEKIKSLVKNQTLMAEYAKYQEKFQEIKTKLQKISPQLVELDLPKTAGSTPELTKLLQEIKSFLEKIKASRALAEADIKNIDSLLLKLKKYL